ncbi:MAG TPA: zinc-binding dehydrogenase [Actinomycetota bacterium]|nr:zinc-binding dehydrogenase [Actinomycetota bacterium]
MRVAVLREPGHFELADEPVPAPGRDEVRLRVAVCGVCASELDMWRGARGHATLPWYPGHEVSGVVEQVGPDVTWPSVGEAVAAWVTTRGYADQVVLPAAHCVPIDGTPVELSLAEPLACAINAIELTDLRVGDDVLVIGAGYMGSLLLQLAAQQAPRHVIVADVRDEALERARGLGATHVLNVAETSLSETVDALTDGVGVDVSIEATGSQPALSALGDVTRMSGTVVIAGYHQGEPRQVDLATWNWKAFRIANAHFRDVGVIMHGMRRAGRLLASKRIAMEPLVTHRFPLDRIDDAFRTAVEKPPGFVKAVVHP